MTSAFLLEPLEARLLLAADLTGVLQSTLIDPAVPTNNASAIVQVQNVGNQLVNQSQVGVYASLDTILDASDVLLGTANTDRVNVGQSKNITVNLAIPNTLDPIAYRMLAKVDNANAIAENSETNNVAIGGTINVAWKFGAVPGRTGNTTLTLIDSDGTQVTFTLTGGGLGEVIRDGTKWDLRVTSSTTSSALTIATNSVGNGRVTMDDIHVFGPLGALVAVKCDLIGTLAIDGPVPATNSGTLVTLGSVNGGIIAAPKLAVLTIGNPFVAPGNLTNATILIGATLGADGKLGGTGVNADIFGQGSLGALVVVGNVTGSSIRVGVDPADGIFGNGNDTIVGGTASAIGALAITGTLSDDSRIIAGSFTTNPVVGRTAINVATDPLFFTDTTAPTLSAALAQDTGSSAIDQSTNNPTITGTLTDNGTLASFKAGFGATATFDILSDRQATGSFTLTPARLNQINGAPLTDGAKTLVLLATDADGNSTQITVPLTLDTTVTALTFDLAATSDTPPVGDQQTTAATVTLTGQTEANALVELLSLGLQTTADATGNFSFATIALAFGANTFTARATDTAGNQRTFARTITHVAVGNSAPVLNAIGSQAVNELQLLTFTATATDGDLPANTLTYSLAGTVPSGANIEETTGLFTWLPTEAQGPGLYTFDVVVSDGTLSDSETITVAVAEVNAAPVLNLISNQTVSEGDMLTFTASASDADLPLNSLTFSLQGIVPTAASIDANSGLFTWMPSEAQGPGSFTFDVVVTDNGVSALSDSETITVTVTEVNVAPVLTAIGNQTVNEGDTLTFTASASDADLPTNSLTFTLTNAPAGASIDPTTGLFTWTPTEGQGPGIFVFDVVVTDNGSPNRTDSETITVTVTEVNVAPVLNTIGSQAVNEGAMLTFTTTAVDSDVPGQALTFSLLNAPAGATIDANSGLFTWLPTEAQGPGLFTFDVVVSDGALTGSETITVTVVEVNSAPVLGVIGNQTIDEGTLLTFTATSTDSDLPAQALTFNLDNAPAGATIDANSGVFAWTPTEAQGPGTYNFTVNVNDGTVTVGQSVQVRVNEVNNAPVLTAIGNQTINELQLLTFTVTATDGDLPANTLTYSLAGTVPSGASIDPTTGVFTWTPTAMQSPGTVTFNVVVSDNGTPAMSDSETITVTVANVNSAPSGADKTITINEDTPYTFSTADFGFTDPLDSPANDFQAVKITTLPGGGTLTINGTPVNAGDLVSPDPMPTGATWTARESSRVWVAVASSVDGTKLVAAEIGGQLYTSTDAGMTWAARESNRLWWSVASSADGERLVAAEKNGQLYTSTDAGVTWMAHASSQNWQSVASSADGAQLVAAVNGGQLYTSTDAGVTWTARENSRGWETVASSADGTKLVAGVLGGQLYTSTDAGVTWTARESSRGWWSVASSADGTQLIAAEYFGRLYTSMDGGVTWMAHESSRGWFSVASSADGSKLVAAENNGQLYTSTDAGVTWMAHASSQNWQSVASSADGAQLVAAVAGGQLYTSVSQVGLVYTPAANVNGNSLTSFTFQVQDNGGTANTGVDLDQTANTISFNVTPVNDAPVLDAIGNQAVNELQLLTFTATATDGDLPPNTLTFSLAGTVPSGASIEETTGLFTWTPTEAQGPGLFTFDVLVSDGALTDSETITVTVAEVNQAPVLDAIGNQAVNELQLLTFTATATDNDLPAQGLTFSLAGTVPSGATIDAVTGMFTWTPTSAQVGAHQLTVRVTDNGSPALFDEEMITVTVNQVNVAPVVVTDTYTMQPNSTLLSGITLLKDIFAGIVGSNPNNFTNVNGTLFFAADDGVNGRELWKSDGTAAGTVLVKDILAGSSSSSPQFLTNVNGRLFFRAFDAVNRTELWKSDGTAAGTVLVKDIVPGSSNSSPEFLTNVNGTLFFTANNGTSGAELWKSNGTAAGTVLVKDIVPGSSSSNIFNLTNVNGMLFFTATDGVNGVELWKSDGTAAGTVLVKDILAGSVGSSPFNLTNVNGTLFFTATDGVNGVELWKSDGTAGGTVLVKDILAGSSNSSPQFLTNVNGTLFFLANDGVNGAELWATGTVATVLANDMGSDSATLTANLVTGPSNGTLVLNSDGSFVYRPNAGFSGTDSFTYTATDGISTSNVGTATITVTPTLNIPPPVSFVRTSTSITVMWTTNLPSTSTLRYGIGSNTEGFPPVTDPTLVTSHSMTVTGLAPNTIYTFRLESTSADGQFAQTGPFATRTNP